MELLEIIDNLIHAYGCKVEVLVPCTHCIHSGELPIDYVIHFVLMCVVMCFYLISTPTLLLRKAFIQITFHLFNTLHVFILSLYVEFQYVIIFFLPIVLSSVCLYHSFAILAYYQITFPLFNSLHVFIL